MSSIFSIQSCFLSILLFASCNKNQLQEQPNNSYGVPRTPEDYLQLLDNEQLFSQTPADGIESADEYYVTDLFYSQIDLTDKRLYAWHPDIYDDKSQVVAWNICYEQVYNANLVLEGLDKTNEQSPLYNMVKGTALFFRAYSFYNLSQLYAPPYDSAIAASHWGIPLRLDPDVRKVSTRSTVGETYQQIIDDLQAAIPLLPLSIDWVHRNRPARVSAYALLARVYLCMRQYAKAMAAANEAIRLHPTLIDYNTLDLQQRNPFKATNEETLYQSRIQDNNFLAAGFSSGGAGIDSSLYRLYETGDIRRTIYFDTAMGIIMPKSSYYGDNMLFTGLATDELYLIRAECRARQRDVAGALVDLNTLREKRWDPPLYVPLYTQQYQVALQWILTERRRELVLRGLRWTDLRRLNKEPGGDTITLTRHCEGQLLQLPPLDPRYTLPLPPQVIKENNLQQNPR